MITIQAAPLLVTYADVTEFETHKFVQEASTLGLAPGVWPAVLLTDMGNGQPFALEAVHADGVRVYRQVLGILQLHILND